MMAQKSTTINLDTMSAEELKALAESAGAKFAEKQAEAMSSLRAEIEERVASLNTTVAELFGLMAAPRPARRVEKKQSSDASLAKHRSPDGKEWSGRGRKPNWLVALEAEGKGTSE